MGYLERLFRECHGPVARERAWLFAVATKLVRDEARRDSRERKRLSLLSSEANAAGTRSLEPHMGATSGGGAVCGGGRLGGPEGPSTAGSCPCICRNRCRPCSASGTRNGCSASSTRDDAVGYCRRCTVRSRASHRVQPVSANARSARRCHHARRCAYGVGYGTSIVVASNATSPARGLVGAASIATVSPGAPLSHQRSASTQGRRARRRVHQLLPVPVARTARQHPGVHQQRCHCRTVAAQASAGPGGAAGHAHRNGQSAAQQSRLPHRRVGVDERPEQAAAGEPGTAPARRSAAASGSRSDRGVRWCSRARVAQHQWRRKGAHSRGARPARRPAARRPAAPVASFGMLLRDSEYKGNSSAAQILEQIRAALGDDVGGYRAEFVPLVERWRSMGITAGERR